MKTALFVAALFVALSARAENDPKPTCVGECPKKDVDWIFYRYGTDCYGLDWNFLHAVAQAESGLDPKNHTGHYVGLFQMDTEACGDNIGTSKSYLSCSDLEDPEVNALVATNRFNRLCRRIGPVDIVTLLQRGSQQMNQVAPAPAPCVQNPRAGADPAFQQLVKQVDVDGPELLGE